MIESRLKKYHCTAKVKKMPRRRLIRRNGYCCLCNEESDITYLTYELCDEHWAMPTNQLRDRLKLGTIPKTYGMSKNSVYAIVRDMNLPWLETMDRFKLRNIAVAVKIKYERNLCLRLLSIRINAQCLRIRRTKFFNILD